MERGEIYKVLTPEQKIKVRKRMHGPPPGGAKGPREEKATAPGITQPAQQPVSIRQPGGLMIYGLRGFARFGGFRMIEVKGWLV